MATAAVEPKTWATAGGIVEKPIYYAESWMTVKFESYESMTQQQFQDATVPFTNTGKSVPIEVTKGWRRVETALPGKHAYVQMETGTIAKYPKEYFDCGKEAWMHAEGTKISEEELMMGPEERALQMALKVHATQVKEVAVVKKEEAPKPKAKKEEVKEEAPAVAAVEDKPAEAPAAAVEEPAAEAIPAVPAEPPLPVGLLFPGQGSQYVKMLSGVRELPKVKEYLAIAQDILGYDLLELCLKGPESKLEQTKFCQPAMYVGGMAAVERLREQKPERIDRVQAVAGLSLGEYTALTVAGVFDFETGMKIVKLRGEVMQEAAEASKQSMLSVAGLSQEQLSDLCKECTTGPDDVCQIANFLFPNGFSCAGTSEAVEKLMAKAQKTEGCLQAKLLKTSGGFHTSLMTPAKAKLLACLDEMKPKMKPPRCDVYMNVTGQKITPATKVADIIPMLGDQICNCVQWEPSMREMIKDGITEFYECGPMKQLKAMMKRIDPGSFKVTTTIDV